LNWQGICINVGGHALLATKASYQGNWKKRNRGIWGSEWSAARPAQEAKQTAAGAQESRRLR